MQTLRVPYGARHREARSWWSGASWQPSCSSPASSRRRVLLADLIVQPPPGCTQRALCLQDAEAVQEALKALGIDIEVLLCLCFEQLPN